MSLESLSRVETIGTIGTIGRIGRIGRIGTDGINEKFPSSEALHIERSAPINPIKGAKGS